jgi:UDP-N-acetylmuramate: L-alanyl-gamma-D-glutamyl-meso-diaminopimelate ligase
VGYGLVWIVFSSEASSSILNKQSYAFNAQWSFQPQENHGMYAVENGEIIAGSPLARRCQHCWMPHNRMNARAAIAAANHIGIASSNAAQALASFKNVKRRLEVVGSTRQITVYDDFAHHPTAIATTIEGLRKNKCRNSKSSKSP